MINENILVGRLTRDPKISTTSTGDEVVHFTLAVKRQIPKGEDGQPIKVKQTADFIPCVAWKSKARLIADSCKKGSKIGVTGKLCSRVITMEDNSTRTIIEVKVVNVEFFDPKNKDNAMVDNNTAAEDMGMAESVGDENIPW